MRWQLATKAVSASAGCPAFQPGRTENATGSQPAGAVLVPWGSVQPARRLIISPAPAARTVFPVSKGNLSGAAGGGKAPGLVAERKIALEGPEIDHLGDAVRAENRLPILAERQVDLIR